MGISAWHLWVVVAVLLFVGEIFAPTFLLACLGFGCLASALAAGLGFGIKGQLVGFIVGTLVTYFGVRPFFQKYMHRSSGTIKTNIDGLVGMTGIVTSAVNARSPSGRVQVRGDDWRAVNAEGGVLEPGASVEVLRVEGTKLFVKKT